MATPLRRSHEGNSLSARRTGKQSIVTVAISTMGTRAAQVSLPAPEGGLRYIVLVQKAEAAALPQAFERPDVTVVELTDAGIANSRNAALKLADTEFLLFCDDDIRLSLDGIAAMKAALAGDKALSFVMGWRGERFASSPRAKREYQLTPYNSGRVAVPELLVRLVDVKTTDLTFDSAFGVGARFPIGEDYIFVTDMLKAGLSGMSLPVLAGWHDGQSTGDIWDDPVIVQARIAMLKRVFGRRAPLLRTAYAAKHRKALGSIKAVIKFALGHA